jgi:spermidine/putrescine-binding protein
MKDLTINVEETKVTTSTFSYWFEDEKGFKVKVDGFNSREEMEKDVKKKLKTLKKYKPIYK